ncbi:MAG: ATP-binding protein [Polyangiaceae bacterium]|nr:ATP-binding protein [Polyangiaceae bacterium]
MRYLEKEMLSIWEEGNKMVFLAGPRQVGKTTLATSLLANKDHYFNWDVDTQRAQILKEKEKFFRLLPPAAKGKKLRLVLDEIHKYPRWKRFLKGLWDAHRAELELLVTGSGRLNIYQKGGDSLFGRYALFRLAPFTAGELLKKNAQKLAAPDAFLDHILHSKQSGAEEALQLVERWTGFPEPLFAQSQKQFVRWRRARRELVFKEDLRDLTLIRDLGLVEQMTSLLPARVGSLLSINSLREDVGVAYTTAQGWLQALERLYYHIELRPYAGTLTRTLKREGKIYLFDPSELENVGAKFENVVALHLQKIVDAWNDCGEGDFALHFVRDKEKREVDFLIVRDRKPWLLVECKTSDTNLDPSLSYFHERLKPKLSVQLVRNGTGDKRASLRQAKPGIWIVPAADFLGWC